MNQNDRPDDETPGMASSDGNTAAEPVRSDDGESAQIRVNGVEISVERRTDARVSEILTKAKDKDAIAGDPGDYILQTRSGKTFERGETIEVTPGEDLLAMPGGSTPVA